MDEVIDFSKVYSYSKLSLFDQCLKAYHFTYIDPIYSKLKNKLKKMPENIFKFYTLGRAVHNAITLFYHSPAEQKTAEQLKDFLKGTWVSEVMGNKKPPLGKWGGFASLEEERETYGEALGMLANFLRIAEIEPEIEFLPTNDFRRSIDDYKKLITPLSENIDISGKFDLITRNEDGSLNIVDFKTGRREDNDQYQLKFYQLLAEEKFKKPVKKASFYFLKSGNISDFDLDDGKDEFKGELLNKIEKIKVTEDFITRPGKLCRFCLFKDFCPEKEKVKEFVRGVKGEEYADDLPF